MRVLFLHSAYDLLTAEYKVHLTLANSAPDRSLESVFLWQQPIPDGISPGTVVYAHNFGRNMSIVPKPSRYRRAAMILPRIPGNLGFLIAKTREVRPDLIYTSQQTYDLLYASMLSYIFSIPHAIHIHYNVGPWLGRFALEKIRRSSSLLAVSDFIRQSAIVNGANADTIHTIPNTILTARFNHLDRAESRQRIRAEFGLPAHASIVLAVGRLDPMKGHDDLLDAFSKISEEIPTTHLLICGRGTYGNDYEQQLREKTRNLGLASKVIYAGWRDDIPAVMRGADVFCLPSRLEPFGLVYLEAMTCGLPVIAYDSGGVPEIVVHERTGLISIPGDIAGLADNLRKVLSNPKLRQQMGEEGRRHVSSAFAPQRIAARWLNILGAAVEAR